MPEIKIEKNVRIPNESGRTGAPCKYPWSSMQLGESFYVPVKSASMSATARNAAYKTGYKFRVRVEGKGSRIWRVA